MSIKRVASRYAKSIIDLALETNRLEAVKKDMESLQTLLKQNRELFVFLKSPVIKFTKKQAVLSNIFKGKVDDLTLKFMTLLASKQREAYLPEIINQFIDQYRALKHISIVKVTSATEMTPEMKLEMQKKLEASSIGFEHVEMITKVDPSLIGGFIIELDDHVYDTSIKHQLETLRKQFTGNLYESKIVAR